MVGEAIIVAIVTGTMAYLGTRNKSTSDVKVQEVNSAASTEAIYIQNMELILTEYKEQVESFRVEVQALRDENHSLKAEFEKFKKKHHKEMNEYRRYIKLLKKENEDLKVEIVDLEEIIESMKGCG